jgi:hypothetical protein
MLETANAEAQRQARDAKIRYTAGFRLIDRPIPYILIQPTELPGSTYEEIERFFINDANGAKGTRDAAVSTPVLDRSRNQITTRIEQDLPGLGKLKSLTTAFIGSQEIVSVHCYAMESDYERYLPTFTAINDSFRYDAGYGFVPGSAPAVHRGGGSPILGALVGAAIAALIGGLIYLLKRIFKRKANAPDLTEV